MEVRTKVTPDDAWPDVLILGVGNVLLGDEGVGVRVVEELSGLALPEGVECMDGGTGSFVLLGPMHGARKVVLVDATADGDSPGTVHRLRPRFAAEYPRTLTAHDVGLKDLLDAYYLLGREPDVTLFAVSISPLGEPTVDLSPEVAAAVPRVVRMVLDEVRGA